MRDLVLEQPKRCCVRVEVLDAQSLKKSYYRTASIREAMRYLKVGKTVMYKMLESKEARYITIASRGYLVSCSYQLTGDEQPISEFKGGE